LRNSNDETKQELIIVRRSGGHDEGGHGGAWKIAYADFMTAMMAFFLVMWLVNSTDEKKIVQVAAYFNPIRLSDKVKSERGPYDGTIVSRDDPIPDGAAGKKPPDAKTKATSKEVEKPEGRRETKKRVEKEHNLFADPAKALAEIAPLHTLAKTGASADATKDKEQPVSVSALLKGEIATTVEQAARRNSNSAPASAAVPSKAHPSAIADAINQAANEKMEQLKLAANALESELKIHLIDHERQRPRIDVKATPEGLLISLTDDPAYGMFAIASAEPHPQLVLVMDQLGRILQRRSERIVIRGHTDSRVFRTTVYDNWRLSTARAQMALYMLLRSGVQKDRLARIEGHADSLPRNPADLYAAENRRIEILLQSPAVPAP
jgi:chemotaxis protein MotB